MTPLSLATVHLLCAARTRGCQQSLTWEELLRPGTRTDTPTAYGRRLLELNGWRLDHGRWVCWRHPDPADPQPPDSEPEEGT